YGLANLAFDHNFAQGLQFQQLYGGGVGYTVIDTAKQQLDFKADVHYERQNFFVSSSNVDLIGSIFGENYHRNLPRKLVFTEEGIFLPTWKRLGITFNATDNYLNNPSPGYKANSFQFVAGVNYALK